MKKLTKIFLILFIIGSSLLGLVQSPWGKKLALHLLIRAMEQSKVKISVEEVTGSLPQNISLKNVLIQKEGWEVSAQSLQIQISILHLLRKELFVKELKADRVFWSSREENGETPSVKHRVSSSLPFILHIRHFHLTQAYLDEHPIELEGSLRIKRNGEIRFSVDTKSTELSYGPLELSCHGAGRISGLIHGQIQGHIRQIPITGDFSWSVNSGNGQLEGYVREIPEMAPVKFAIKLSSEEKKALHIQALYETTHWAFGSFPIEKLSGEIDAIWRDQSWSGSGAIRAEIYKQSWRAVTDFSWSSKTFLQFKCWSMEGPTLTASGNFLFRPDGLIEGENILHVDRLQALQLPFVPLYGAADATVLWKIVDNRQALHLEVEAKQLFWESLFTQQLILYSDLFDPFQTLQGNLHLDLSGAKWKQLDITAVNVHSQGSLGNWPFHIAIEGKWKHPLEIKIDGFFQKNEQNWTAHLQDATGSFYNHPFSLISPFIMEKGVDQFRCSPMDIQFANGSMSAHFVYAKEQTDGEIMIRQLPIDMLSLNPLDISIGGFFDLDASFTEQKEQFSAKLEAGIKELEVITSQEEKPLKAFGHVVAEFQNKRLEIDATLADQERQLIHMDLNLPLDFQLWPLQLEVLKTREVQGNLVFQADIEDLLDFFDLGVHRFQGKMDCRLSLARSLNHPLLTGSCIWKNGAYQNYYTGTQLENIAAEWFADGDNLILRFFTARDYLNKGNLTAQGKITLDPQEWFPFDFHLNFEHLNCVEIDLVSAEATGDMQIVGTFQESWAKGDMTILQSRLTIPDHIPRSLPKLQVVYRNPTHPISPPSDQKIRYPVHLDLKVVALDGIYIGGRGLNSEWKGDFYLGGTADSPTAKGKLELIQGEFVFASRRFKLSEGALSLSGKEHEMPNLNIAASIEQNNVVIVARLKGPLNQPQLTFQSVPPLPMSSILAHLLFGEDLSEINGIQALQLANSIANIAGEGPDILENTRRSLGVDRLRIITVPAGSEEGEDAIALQVGKYVAQGVIISISQGAEDNSSNISIEVELKYGFAFQAETQQQQEQGKFTIKWNLNY